MLTAEQLKARAGKLCLLCGAELHPHDGEKPYAFRRRIMCGLECASVHASRTRWSRERPSAVERFELKYIPDAGTGCWLWTGARVPDGYGSFGIRTKRTKKAHRVSWELHRGAIPRGMHVLHRCDNRLCVNPDHLFLGDNAANVADRVAKGRSASKLSRSDEMKIAADSRPQRLIAMDYGVAQVTVCRAKRRAMKC